MSYAEIEADTDRFLRRIRRKKIKVPGPGQHVDICHYSKTGWGIWEEGGGCTCEPAKKPKLVAE